MSDDVSRAQPLFTYRRLDPSADCQRHRPFASGMAQDELVELLTLHHNAMSAQLSALVANLYESFGHAGQPNAMRTLVIWCESVLIAHATAIEDTLFAPARTLDDVAFHIDRLRHDHESMRNLVTQIGACDDPQQAMVAAQKLSALFDDHTKRAHRHLLESLSRSDEHDLASLVELSGALSLDGP